MPDINQTVPQDADNAQRKQGAQQFFSAQQMSGASSVSDRGDVVTIDLAELLAHCIAKWKMIVLLTLIGGLVSFVITAFFITPKYKATSTIYVLSNKSSAVNLSDLQIGTQLTPDYMKLFKMWEVHEQVIRNLNLPYNYDQVGKMLSVTNDANTRLLDVSVTSPSAEEAAAMANEYAKVASQYISETMSTDKPNIVSVALVPDNPDSPKLTLNVVIGVIAGFVIAIIIIIVRMVSDDKYKTPDDIKKYTGLATLAVIALDNRVSETKAKADTSKTEEKKS